MTFKSMIRAISVCAALLSFNANAVPTFTHGGTGKISGALNLDIGGDLYNMTLHDSSFISAFPTNSDGLYTDAFAESASRSLAAFLLTENGNFLASDFLGCLSTVTICRISTGYDIYTHFGTPLLRSWNATQFDGEPVTIYKDTRGNVISSNPSQITYASWALAASVPEPSIAILLGSGLIAFAVVRRKART